MAYLGSTPTTQAFTAAVDYFTANGSTSVFTLSRPVASVAQVEVVVNNVVQNPSDAYTVNGNTLTLTSVPAVGGSNNIYVKYVSPVTQTAAIPQDPQVFGDLQFSSPGARITGDFSNATVANRVAFQSSTTNGATHVNAFPNGTGSAASFRSYSSSDPDNASVARFQITSTAMTIASEAAGTGTNVPMTFSTGGAERLRISASGNMGLGTTPASGWSGFTSFQIGGSAALWSNGNNMFLSVNAYNDGANNRYINTGTASRYYQLTGDHIWESAVSGTAGNVLTFNQRMSLSNAGVLTLPAYGTGTLYTNSGALTNINPSDRNLKESIVDIPWGLDEIMQLRPVSFVWKNDVANQGTQYGWIAQEVQEIMPDLVRSFEMNDGDEKVTRLGLEKDGIYAALVKAIQELNDKLEAQAAEITALKAKVGI